MGMKGIPVKVAAALMGKGEQFVRVGLQRRLLPIGVAYPTKGKAYCYYISPAEFMRYTGITVAPPVGAWIEI